MFDEHEPARPELNPELAAIERRLAKLTPTALRLDRDRLMFEAGRAAARPRRPGYIAEPSRLGGRVWPAVAMLMTAASLLLGVMLLWEREALQVALQQNMPIAATQVAEQSPEGALRLPQRPEVTTASWASSRQPTTGYLGVRYTALTRGVGAIESSVEAVGDDRDSSRDPKSSRKELLNELLPSSAPFANPRS